MELVCTQHLSSQITVPMQAHCTKGVTNSDGSEGTKKGGDRVGVGNGVDIVNGDGLEREI